VKLPNHAVEPTAYSVRCAPASGSGSPLALARFSNQWYAISMKQSLVAEILELPVAERMQLVEAIWDSISAVPEALPLTQWQREELDRRLAEYEADPDSGATLEEVFARIRRSS